jgi:hypothetical protein
MEVKREYGRATTIYFTMVKAGATDLAVTGDWTPATGDTKISKDGGSVTNAANNPAIVSGTGSVLWSLALTATEMAANEIDIQIVDGATKAVEDNVIVVTTRLGAQLAAHQGIIVGEVDTVTFTATTTQLEAFSISPTTTEEATADHFNGTLIKFISGAAQGAISAVTDYELANSKMKFTYDAIVTAPADGDHFVIL